MEYDEFWKLVDRADAKMKEDKGHLFLTILRTRCTYCGRSPKQNGKCRYWLKSLLVCIYEELQREPQQEPQPQRSDTAPEGLQNGL